MSSEEKEPYFDGPLVTTPAAQALYYPGANPPPSFPPPSGMQQTPPVQAFYGGGMNAEPWAGQSQQPFQPSYNAEDPGPGSSGVIAGGAQAYFGGVDSSSSAPSREQTAPAGNLVQPNINDLPLFNPMDYRQHVNPIAASTLFTPAMAGAGGPSNTEPDGNQFEPEQDKLDTLAPTSLGASGQQNFVPTLNHFGPTLPAANTGVQNYMNPMAQGSPQISQAPFFIPNSMQNALHPRSEAEDRNRTLPSQIDLHNGTPSYMSSSDQSYMTFNDNGPGNNQNQGNAFVPTDYQAPSIMYPVSSSGQDYDILHSQGTFRDQRSRFEQHDQGQAVATLNASAGAVTDVSLSNIGAVGGVQSNEGGHDIRNDYGDALKQEESHEDSTNLEPPAHQESVENQLSGTSLANDNFSANPTTNAPESTPETESLKRDDNTNRADGDSATLTLDYQSSVDRSQVVGAGIAFAPVYPPDPRQSSQNSELIPEDNADKINPPPLPELSSQELQNQGYAVGGEAPEPAPDQTKPESPIPADGLHHMQPALDVPTPVIFASPNSAFESRIRSQSTGSSNGSASGRVAQNRNAAHGAAATVDFGGLSRTDTVPTSSPFSTEAMHSSHNPDPLPPAVASTTPSIVRATVPDIVRPLPPNQSEENLRTGATAVPFSSNQSLHSQVLRNPTAYPPEPKMQSSGASSGRSQPDLVQSPLEGAGAIRKAVVKVSNSVMGLKVSDTQSGSDPPPVSSAASELPTTKQDPYLSHTLHNSSSNLKTSNVGSNDRLPSLGVDLSAESSLTHSNTKNDDSREPITDDRTNYDSASIKDEERRGHGEYAPSYDPADSRRDIRDSRYDHDPRRREEDYRYDSRYGGGWDQRPDRTYRDDGYGDLRPRHEHQPRPSSRVSGYGPEDSYYARQYEGRYYESDHREAYGRDHRYPYYRDTYYDSYSGYGRSYDPYDHPRRNHHDYTRYSDYRGYGPGHESHMSHYYQHPNSRRPDQGDSSSVRSERLPPSERDSMADPGWSYGHDYDNASWYRPEDTWYGDSIVDGSTVSNTYDETWDTLPIVPARQTPVKFGSVHTIVRFGAGGQLIKVRPNRPTDNQPTVVEIHSVELLLQDTPEAEDLRTYPGPLFKEETHKNDVLQYTSNLAVDSMKDSSLMDRQSTALIWEFLALLVRQNGSVLGTDIAELLTRDHSGDFALLQSPLDSIKHRQTQYGRATPSSVSDEPCASSSPIVEQAETKSVVSNVSVDVSAVLEKNCFRFRDLLLHGRKKDALEWAMKSGLWGHALLLASKTDNRTHAQVMLRFANSLPINDPLQTVYQLMSGRQPAAATCVSEDGWGDWRPHLAMILSNPTPNPSLDMRAVLTMGDTLSGRGLLHAAHFCYLMSSTPLGYYGRTSSKMVLLGGNHTLSFNEFANWESIRRTEIYEYAISLGKQQKSTSSSMSLPSLQVYKFLYACKLAEYGLIAQAFHYCERIAKSICNGPKNYSETLTNQVVNLSDQLRHHDPQIAAGVSQAGNLRWLEALRGVLQAMQTGSIQPRSLMPSSGVTTSDTPSTISSTPSGDDSNIGFTAHTPDFEADVTDSNAGYGYQPVPVGQDSMYNHDPQVYERPGSAVMNTGVATQQPPLNQHSQIGVSTYNAPGYQPPPGPATTYMNPSDPYQQPGPAGEFSSLANQANPLASAYPYAGEGSGPYHTQTSYGFQPQPNEADDVEQRDQVDDYYGHIESSHRGPPQPPRARTTSQSSQRSRGSTARGYDRQTPTAAYTQGNSMQPGRRSRTVSENSTGKKSRKASGEQKASTHKQDDNDGEGMKKSRSWLTPVLGLFMRRKSNQVHLPDDNQKDIVWDNEKKRWVNKNGTEEDSAPPPPPPTDSALNPAPMFSQPMPTGAPAPGQSAVPSTGPPQLTANRFSLKTLGVNRVQKPMYKNAFGSSSKPAAPAPVDLPGMVNNNISNLSGFMIPGPVPTSQPTQAQVGEPSAQRNQINPDTPQAIQPANVPNMMPTYGAAPTSQNTAPSGVPTMFFNPSQLSAQPDLLSQPGMPPTGQSNNAPGRGRGRPAYPGRAYT